MDKEPHHDQKIIMDDTLVNAPQQKRSVLIIEDEHFITELYMRALEKAGYSVTAVQDGEKGLLEAVNKKYDVILLDLMLPTMNGVDLLYKMKSEHVKPPLASKIIITTNLDQKEDLRAKIEQMADGYLIKAEITPKELVDYVNQVIGE